MSTFSLYLSKSGDLKLNMLGEPLIYQHVKSTNMGIHGLVRFGCISGIMARGIPEIVSDLNSKLDLLDMDEYYFHRGVLIRGDRNKFILEQNIFNGGV